MVKKKTDFKWDHEKKLGVVDISEKERRLVSLCGMDDYMEDGETVIDTQWYVSIGKMKFFKETWNFTGGFAIPLDNWLEVVDLVDAQLEDE